jgi:ribosomal protein L37AE/L43A
MLALALRILRLVNRAYPFVALAGYMAAFLVAFICVFTFPLGALSLVVLGVLSLAFVALGSDALRALERAMSRAMLRRGRCPMCRLGPVDREGVQGWRCRGCAGRFEGDGSERAESSTEPEQDAALSAA